MLSKLGNRLFHYRNVLFPIFYLALFIPSKPVFQSNFRAEIIGCIIILGGMLVRSVTIGLVYIVRGGKNRTIYAEDLVTGGIYSLCRNPMYFGNILLLLGFAFFANSILFISVFFPLFILFYLAIIEAEEAFLENKFGETFAEYRKNVNYLLPDLRKTKKAFKGQKFKWKKVIYKEHNGFFIFFSGIFLLMFYKGQINLLPLVFIITGLAFLNGMVKYMKWKHPENET